MLGQKRSLRQDLEHRTERQAEGLAQNVEAPFWKGLSPSAAVLKKLAGGGPQSGSSERSAGSKGKALFSATIRNRKLSISTCSTCSTCWTANSPICPPVAIVN